jgi:hypothetical protein
MKVWITKYALTEGIIAMDVLTRNHSCVYPHGSHNHGLRLGACAHETQEAAVKHAEKMRLNKIASLKAQIAKLEKMRFGVELTFSPETPTGS